MCFQWALTNQKPFYKWCQLPLETTEKARREEEEATAALDTKVSAKQISTDATTKINAWRLFLFHFQMILARLQLAVSANRVAAVHM